MKRIAIAAMLLSLALILVPAQTARAEGIPGPPCDECGGSTIVIPGDWDNHYIMCQDITGSCSIGFQLVPQSHEREAATCISGAVCTICGQEFGDKNPNNHNWSDWTYESENLHTRTCKNGCGASQSEMHIIGKCTCIGGVCMFCGFVNQDYHFLNPYNHAGPITPATCTYKAFCNACYRYFGETNPDNHQGPVQSVERIEPTCTAVGQEAGRRCAACNAYTQGGAEIPVDPNAHTPGEPVREEPYFIPGLYDMVVYCTVCRQELSRTAYMDKTVLQLRPDRFTTFCENLAQLIMLAPENEVKEVDARQWYGLQWNVIKALDQRSDVSLRITCWLNGELAELTIPAGFDLISSLEPGQFLHFNELAKMLG